MFNPRLSIYQDKIYRMEEAIMHISSHRQKYNKQKVLYVLKMRKRKLLQAIIQLMAPKAPGYLVCTDLV